MSSLLADIPSWVASAPIQERNFRRSVHIVLLAIAGDHRLSSLLCMKGGILMALRYGSSRFTTDIDFSTSQAFSEDTETEVVGLLEQRLVTVSDELEYDLDCRLQSYEVKPSRSKTYVSLEIRVGYALRGSKEHARLMVGQGPSVVCLDYNFMESIPFVEEISVGGEGVLRVYALPTLIAEKIRALLQQPIRNRNRRQDIYDIWHLLNERPELESSQCRAIVLEAVRTKCQDRHMEATIDSMDQTDVHDRAAQEYGTLEGEVKGDLPDFEESFSRVREYYRSLPWQA